MQEHPSILIQGIGAMGGVVAANLIRAGHAVTLVAGSKAHAERIARSGLTVRESGGEFHVDSTAYAQVADVPASASFDYVLILTKATSVEDAARDALKRSHDDTVFVALQNGIVEPSVAKIVGQHRVIPSLLNWGATMHEAGLYEHTLFNNTVLGEYDGSTSPRLQQLGSLIKNASDVDFSHNIEGAQWAKLQMNCSVTTLGTLAGMPLAEWLEIPHSDEVFVETCREVNRVAAAAGIRYEPLAVDPHVPDVGTEDEIAAWLRTIVSTYGKTKPSIWQDLLRGKKTEIEFMTGHIVRVGETLGLRVPLCAAVTRMIQEMESGDRSFGAANISELANL